MSAARRAREARLSKHIAAGTYVARHPVSADIVRLVARESRIKRGRESLLEPSEYEGVRTKVLKPSARDHHLAPSVVKAHFGRAVSEGGAIKPDLHPAKVVYPTGAEVRAAALARRFSASALFRQLSGPFRAAPEAGV